MRIGDMRAVEHMIGVFQQHNMPEEVVKAHIEIANHQGDYGTAKALTLQLKAMREQRYEAEPGLTAVRQLAGVL